MQVVQRFDEEGALGYLMAYATFSDGLVLDVSDEVLFSSLAPGYIEVQNRTHPTDPSTATITAKASRHLSVYLQKQLTPLNW